LEDSLKDLKAVSQFLGAFCSKRFGIFFSPSSSEYKGLKLKEEKMGFFAFLLPSQIFNPEWPVSWGGGCP
jgi:hypothetical protein